MDRTQRICVDSSLSSTKILNGGIPQGTRLGSILFAVIVYDPGVLGLNLLMI